MTLPEVHVLVSFRFDAGTDLPKDKQLMARVFNPGSGADYGDPIAKRKRITNFSALKTEIVHECSKVTKRIHIHVDEMVVNYLSTKQDVASEVINL